MFVSGLSLVVRGGRNIEQKKKEKPGCNGSTERGIKNDTEANQILSVLTRK